MSIDETMACLRELRLPDLQRKYAEIIGEPSRSPNKVFLLRRIEEVLRAREAETLPEAGAVGQAEHGEVETVEPERIVECVLDGPAEPKRPEPDPMASDEEPHLDAPIEPEPTSASETGSSEARATPPEESAANADSPAASGDPELSPDDAGADELGDGAPSGSDNVTTVTADGAAAPLRQRRPRSGLAQMSVEELHAAYVREVGRPTTSTDKPYLAWKIRQARNGKIRVGETRQQRTGQSQEKQVVPLPLPRGLVQALDDIVSRTDHRSRTSLLRRALATYLRFSGFADVASLMEDA